MIASHPQRGDEMKIPLAPFIRIGLRYLSAALVAKGVFSPESANIFTSDPELVAAIEVAAGLFLAAVAEVWHALKLKKER
jgi:hypothetical protein